jgi:hypothetical protein
LAVEVVDLLKLLHLLLRLLLNNSMDSLNNNRKDPVLGKSSNFCSALKISTT